ncbi:MAG: hypothetical protein R3C61_14960 [Bacteroidia bacterium]
MKTILLITAITMSLGPTGKKNLPRPAKEPMGIVIVGKPKVKSNNTIKCKGSDQVCATFDENGENGILARIFWGDDENPTEQFYIESYSSETSGDETVIHYVPVHE